MIPAESLLVYAAALVAGLLLGEVWERLIWPLLPGTIQRAIQSLGQKYLNLWRRALPDRFYRLWYETGIMDKEAYRQYQERGFIKSDLDPEYIQRTNSD